MINLWQAVESTCRIDMLQNREAVSDSMRDPGPRNLHDQMMIRVESSSKPGVAQLNAVNDTSVALAELVSGEWVFKQMING